MKVAYIHLYGSKVVTYTRCNVIKKELTGVFPEVLIDVRKPIPIHILNDYSKVCGTTNSASNIANNNDTQNNSIERSESYFQGNGSTYTWSDGFMLQRIYSDFIGDDEMELGRVHVIFEDNLVATYDEVDRRHHARTLICGTPCIISISGIVEAPAKPRDYYFKMMLRDLLTLSNEEIKTQFSGRFIDYGDPSMFRAALGFAIQSVFYFLTDGNPFCSENTCILFNSHWQEEMIRCQVETPRFCKKHEAILLSNCD